MPYLGNIPATQFAELKYQDFTGGTGTSFTLNDPVGSAQELEVFVNNVRQEPGVAYTVSGTALTMTGSIVATDDFYVVFQGKSIPSGQIPEKQSNGDYAFTGAITVTTDDNNPQLTLKSTDDDAASGPILHLFRDSASPADDDVIGQLKYIGKNDAAEDVVYGKVDVVLKDASDGTEDAEMRFLVATEGSNPNLLKLGSTLTVFNDSSNDIDFRVESNNQPSMFFIDAGNDRIGINNASPSYLIDALGTGTGDNADVTMRIKAQGTGDSDVNLILDSADTGESLVSFYNAGNNEASIEWNSTDPQLNIRTASGTNGDIDFQPNNVLAMRIDSNGRVGLGNSSPSGLFEILDTAIGGSSGEAGFRVNNSDTQIQTSTSNSVAMYMNDSSSSTGTHNYIAFRFQGSTKGDIDTTNNDTIRYNTFTGAHWGQFSDHSQPDIKLGTVMSTIDEMCNWTEFEYTDSEGETQKTDIAGTYEIGTTHTIYIDEDGAQATGTAISHDTSKRIAKVKVSDTAGDRTVYGVFAGHYKDGDSSVESLGLGSIRIGSGVTVAIGDLLESAGDGTARPQTGDTSDLIKSSTIAKVTSTIASHTYDDGSYLVPCVLMAG